MPRIPLKQDPSATEKPARRRAVALKKKPQSVATDQFFYFFLRLRKGEIRRVVQRVQSLYPDESTEQLARRLILAQCSLSLVGGALLHLPQLFPGAGNILKLAGFVGGASMMARMNLYLILEVALLYGQDIDDQARVGEMMAVVAASGASAAMPLLVNALEWAPVAAIPASGISASAVSKLVGEAAIAFYKSRRDAQVAAQEAMPALAG
ncbi:hypothetical protein SAMN02949497_2547 [Methylomagnum ishizawai]|uniref:Uncharacterized protein n=1 Tax=Methylomagnum ishizawai TaxID=1760988 RepID=A0A1Y6CY23_9GAMM|nr:hypothetical protein [Methylomagnum ishizawai]SMF95196.1 hypothetical protein SAMN02949497_2547 [Methylomagnum ishizawai]